MQSAPRISIREVFERASQEDLKQIVGSATLAVLAAIDRELLTRETNR